MKIKQMRQTCVANGLPWTIKNRGKEEGKSICYLPQLSRKSAFPPKLQNRAKHLPQLLKPFILPPWPCYKQFWIRFWLFLFYLFRLNLWKIIVNHRKNHKIENPILLDFTWVGLHSKHIIWYVLVQSFYYGFRSMLFCN